MEDAFLAGFIRTPFQPAGLSPLAKMKPEDLAAVALHGLISRANIDPASLDEVVLGCAYPQSTQGANVARLAALLARIPVEVPGLTVSRFGGSSISAIHYAAGQICCAAGEAYLTGGVELTDLNPCLDPVAEPNRRVLEAYVGLGDTAEALADRYRITRSDQERITLASHNKALAAQAGGYLTDEIAPVRCVDGLVETDGCPNRDLDMAALQSIPPLLRPEGSLTKATVAPFADGAAAVLVTSAGYARQFNLPLMARIRAVAAVGCAPQTMGLAAVAASRKALAMAELSIDEMDVIELGEVFASQVMACVQELRAPWEKVNIDGGALAFGQPLGATGARITGKAAQILGRRKGRFALAAQSSAGGQGVATILEAV